MMAALGDFVFELGTLPYQELQRRNEWRFASNARIGARDAYQFVGAGDEDIGLSGVAHAELMDGQASLQALRDMAADGAAWPLVDGSGTVYGNYVVLTVDERQSVFFPDGTPRTIDFGVSLRLVDAS